MQCFTWYWNIMAAIQRARNKNWTLFRCSNAYAFLRVTKHLIAHVNCLFGNKNSNYWQFCWIISEHIKFGKDISLDWCPIADFSEADSISTTGWQSAEYIVCSHLSLVYFGLVKDFDDIIDRTNVQTFWQVFVVWFLLILSVLFKVCLQSRAGWWLCQAFYPLVFAMGCRQKELPKILQSKKGKRRCEAAFVKDTSNYFSLHNLKSLIERFGSVRNLWEGEWEKNIKYVKNVKMDMNTKCDTETFMSGVLNNLLCMHCLKKFHEELSIVWRHKIVKNKGL